MIRCVVRDKGVKVKSNELRWAEVHEFIQLQETVAPVENMSTVHQLWFSWNVTVQLEACRLTKAYSIYWTEALMPSDIYVYTTMDAH